MSENKRLQDSNRELEARVKELEESLRTANSLQEEALRQLAVKEEKTAILEAKVRSLKVALKQSEAKNDWLKVQLAETKSAHFNRGFRACYQQLQKYAFGLVPLAALFKLNPQNQDLNGCLPRDGR